jgi:hypothetical protein
MTITNGSRPNYQQHVSSPVIQTERTKWLLENRKRWLTEQESKGVTHVTRGI